MIRSESAVGVIPTNVGMAVFPVPGITMVLGNKDGLRHSKLIMIITLDTVGAREGGEGCAVLATYKMRCAGGIHSKL